MQLASAKTMLHHFTVVSSHNYLWHGSSYVNNKSIVSTYNAPCLWTKRSYRLFRHCYLDDEVGTQLQHLRIGICYCFCQEIIDNHFKKSLTFWHILLLLVVNMQPPRVVETVKWWPSPNFNVIIQKLNCHHFMSRWFIDILCTCLLPPLSTCGHNGTLSYAKIICPMVGPQKQFILIQGDCRIYIVSCLGSHQEPVFVVCALLHNTAIWLPFMVLCTEWWRYTKHGSRSERHFVLHYLDIFRWLLQLRMKRCTAWYNYMSNHVFLHILKLYSVITLQPA